MGDFRVTGNWMDLHDFEADVCPHCKFNKSWYTLPDWAVRGAVFALDGVAYRVVSTGTSNKKFYPHFSACVTVEQVDAEPWPGLPPAPCEKSDIGVALKSLFALPTIEARDLARAIRVLPAASR